MPQFADDIFLGGNSGQTYMGTGTQAATSVFTGTISSTTLTVVSTQSGDALVVGQYITGSSVTANSYITAATGQNSSGQNTYTLSQSSTVSSNTTMYASGNALLGDPAPMSLGVGPLGRVYVFDTIPQTLQAANIAASQTPAAAGNLTLTAGTSAKSVIRADGTTVIQLDVPRALQVVSGTAAAATLSSVTVSGTGANGKIAFTSQTGLVSGQRVTVSGAASGTGSITGYSNPTTYILTAVTATTAILTTTAGAAVATSASDGGTLTMTFTLGVAPQNMTVSGYDYYGQSMTEVITSSAAVSTAVNGKKAFYQIVSIAAAGATGTTITAGTTDILGLPVRVIDAGYVVSASWANTLGLNSGTLVNADMTATATSTTGDVRGTFLPATNATNGSRRLVMAIAVPAIAVGPNATRVGALGVNQA
jgi:hypothetical protein